VNEKARKNGLMEQERKKKTRGEGKKNRDKLNKKKAGGGCFEIREQEKWSMWVNIRGKGRE